MHCTAWLLVVFLLAGCGYDLTDPYQRPGTYRPVGYNDANLRVMVANPADLVESPESGASLGGEAAPPVARLLAGKRYPLPDLNAAEVNVFSGGTPQQGSANPGTAQ